MPTAGRRRRRPTRFDRSIFSISFLVADAAPLSTPPPSRHIGKHRLRVSAGGSPVLAELGGGTWYCSGRVGHVVLLRAADR